MTDLEIPATLEEARPLFRAKMYGTVPIGLMREKMSRMADSNVAQVTFSVGGELVVGLVLDVGDAEIPVTNQMTSELWQLTDSAAAGLIRETVELGESDGIHKIGDVAFLVTDQDFASAVVLNPSSLSMFDVAGDPVVLAASASTLFIAGSEDVVSLATIVELASRVAEEPDGLVTPVPLVLRDNTLEVFEWPAEPGLERMVQMMQRLFRSVWAGLQAPLLENGSAFVAAPQLFEKDGEAVLVATWTRGVETILPVVDNVAVVDEDGQTEILAFSDIVGCKGVERLNVDPPRFKVAADAAISAN